MKKISFIVLPVLLTMQAGAQNTAVKDTFAQGKITVFKDSRLDLLAKKEAASFTILILLLQPNREAPASINCFAKV